MGKFLPRRSQQIQAEMVADVVARTGLSDVSDTSIVKHLLTAAARQDEEQFFQMVNLLKLFSIDTAVGDDLDERAKDVQPAGITRIQALKSAGTLEFGRTGTTGVVSIPSGTKAKTVDGVLFSTTEVGTIGNGSSVSGEIPAVADVAGASGNAAVSTVTQFVTKPAGVTTVSNPSPFIGGADKESDDAFRSRIKAYIQGLSRSTVLALESGVLGHADPLTGSTIKYSKVIEDLVDRGNVTLYIDDGSGTAETTETVTGENVTYGLSAGNSAVGGEARLFLDYPAVKLAGFSLSSSTRGALTIDVTFWLNPATGQINFDPVLVTGEIITASYTRYTGLVAEAQKIVDGDSSDRENYPGLRAAGILVVVKTPTVLTQTIAVTVTVQEGYVIATVKIAVQTAILNYINTLPISGDVLRSAMFQRIMSVAGVYDSVITLPATNVIIADDSLARTTASFVTVN